MKYIIVILIFLFSLTVCGDNLYLRTLPVKDNPAVNAFKNYAEAGGYYNNSSENYGFYAGTPFLFANIYISSEYNKDLDKYLKSLGASVDFSDFFAVGWTNHYTDSHYIGSMGFLFRLPGFYFGYNYNFNSEVLSLYGNYPKHSVQTGALFFRNISPFINIRQLGDSYDSMSDWSFDVGLTLLHIYGFDFTYQYTRAWDKENIHKLMLQMNLPYFSAGGILQDGDFNTVYSSVRFKRSKNVVFEASNYWLKIKLTGKLPETGRGGVIDGTGYSFIDLLIVLRKALKDDYVKGILFEIDKPSLSSSQAEELLNLFKKYKKRYRVYLKANSLGDYLFSTKAEKTVIHPAVNLDIKGPSITIMFYRNLLEILGIKAYFFKRGKYKTAPEAFTESEPSKYNLEEINKIAKEIKKVIETIISENKKLNGIEKILDEAPYSPETAIKLSLLDGTAYLDDFERELLIQGAELITPSLYNSVFAENIETDRKTDIAVLTIDGTITEKKGIFMGITENYREKILNSITQIKNDPFVSGVIVRVNSPGGSGFVSDEINHALKVLKKYKPVYVSIGNMSASGGYYISVAGDRIFADKMSIVGSIGVFTGKVVLRGIIGKFMINIFTKSLWKNGDLYSMYNLLTEKQIKKMDSDVSDFYDIFLSRVNEGRGIDIKKLREEIAGGRIYMGEQSRKNHLIDETGGFNDALNAMLRDNGLSDNVSLTAYPYNNNFLVNLFSAEKKLLFKLNIIIDLLNTPSLLLSDYEISF